MSAECSLFKIMFEFGAYFLSLRALIPIGGTENRSSNHKGLIASFSPPFCIAYSIARQRSNDAQYQNCKLDVCHFATLKNLFQSWVQLGPQSTFIFTKIDNGLFAQLFGKFKDRQTEVQLNQAKRWRRPLIWRRSERQLLEATTSCWMWQAAKCWISF